MFAAGQIEARSMFHWCYGFGTGLMKCPLSGLQGPMARGSPMLLPGVKKARGADQHPNKTFQALLKCKCAVNQAASWWRLGSALPALDLLVSTSRILFMWIFQLSCRIPREMLLVGVAGTLIQAALHSSYVYSWRKWGLWMCAWDTNV